MTKYEIAKAWAMFQMGNAIAYWLGTSDLHTYLSNLVFTGVFLLLLLVL